MIPQSTVIVSRIQFVCFPIFLLFDSHISGILEVFSYHHPT